MTPVAQPNSFLNRTVIVTGGAGSIGKPLCLAFARAGANVVVNDYGCSPSGEGFSDSPVEKVVQEITSEGFSAVADRHNVATDADKIVQTAIEHFGRIDIIINNAGIIAYGPIEHQDPATVRKVFEVNALGPIAICHYAWPHMKKQRFGRIVNFTSDSVFGMPFSTAYVLSRGAILGVTKTLSLEGQPDNILVNTVGPSAYSRMVADVIQNLPPQQQDAFKATYTGESNVPVIVALASEQNKYTGQVWVSGAYAMGRTAICSIKEIKGLSTVDQCLTGMDELMKKDRPLTEPQSIQDFLVFRSEN